MRQSGGQAQVHQQHQQQHQQYMPHHLQQQQQQYPQVKEEPHDSGTYSPPPHYQSKFFKNIYFVKGFIN